MRGPCYIWRDDDRVHVWAEDGYDGWDDSNWAEGRTHERLPGSARYGGPSGVGLHLKIADAYVVMRLAELICEQHLDAVVESALAKFQGNAGCLALQKLAAAIVSRLEPIGSESAAAEVRSFSSKARRD